jgi:hypothetical protein
MSAPSIRDIPPRIASIIREVSEFHKVGVLELLCTENHTHRVSHVRFEAFYRIRNEAQASGVKPSLKQIGNWFGGLDHTTIHYGLRRFEELHPSKVPPSCRGERRIAYRAPTAPAAHRFQMLSDLAEASA